MFETQTIKKTKKIMYLNDFIRSVKEKAIASGTRERVQNIKKESQKNRRCSLLLLLLYSITVPVVAQADVAGTLNNVLSYLTGPVGKIVATLAIVGMGYACFAMGRVAKSYFISVVIGIAIIFGANALLAVITG